MIACRHCLDDGHLESFPSMDHLVQHLETEHDAYTRTTRNGAIRLDN